MYVNYQVKCLDFMFVEEALEDHLCDTLKELEMKNYNEEGLEMPTLQRDEMLECLKATNGYASRNVLKRCHNIINGAPNSRIIICTFNSLELEVLHLSSMHL